MSIYQSRGYKKCFKDARIHFVERWTWYSGCKVLLFFLNAKLFFPLKRKDENEQLLLTLVFCYEKQDAINKSHRLDFSCKYCIFLATGYGIIQYTDQLLGLKILRTLNPIITRKSRYINYSIIWHVAFFHQSLICRCPFQFTPLKKGSPCNTVFPVLGSTGSLSATARRGFPDRKLPTEREGQEMASDVPYRLVKWHDSGKYKIRRSVALSFS